MPWAPFRWPVEKADWTLTNVAIARQFGISDTTVASARQRLNLPAPLPKIDWAAVDWTQTDPQIARQLDANPANVGYWRKKLGMPKVKGARGRPPYNYTSRPPVTLPDKGPGNVKQIREKLRVLATHPSFRWPVEKVDWTLPNVVIARQFGISNTCVANARRRLNKPRPLPRIDWASVDWTKSDPDLARELGANSSQVGYWRNKAGMPKVKAARGRPTGGYFSQPPVRLPDQGRRNIKQIREKLRVLATQASFRWPVEKADWTLPNAVIARQFGITNTSVGNARKRLGKPGPVSKVDWASVDWTKPNPQIARELGVPANAVHYWRKKAGMPKVKTVYASPIRDRIHRQIVQLLAQRPHNVMQIHKAVGQLQPVTCKYLRLMRESGLVKRRRDVKRVFYSLTAKGRKFMDGPNGETKTKWNRRWTQMHADKALSEPRP